MSFRCFYLITFILLFSGTQGLIQFTQEPSSLIVRPSESVWWHCTARLVGSSTTALSYMWFMDDQLIVVNSNRELFQNGTFHIREVRGSDAGTYHCRAQGGGEIAYSQTGSLSIAELAASFSTSPQSMSINLGNQMSLSCSIESNPQATINWLFDGSPYEGVDVTTTVDDMETKSRLRVAAVEHRHGGQYTCTASNSLLTDQIRLSDPATVTLIGRPGFVTVPSPQVALVGTSTSFQCTTSGSPAATIIWQNENGESIQSSSRFVISSTTLRIIDIQLSDEGYYTCKAFNEYGENTASALLTVTDSFEPVAFTVTPTDQTVVVGGHVTFACDAAGTPEPTLTWTKENSEVPNERISEPAPGWLRISDVEVKDSGLFICTASNGLSVSSTSVQLTVLEGPYFISEPEPVIVEENQLAMLDCVAGGTPEPEISWTTPITQLGTLQTPSTASSNIEVAGNGSLIISSARREHGGSYRCSATNTIGSIQSDAIVTVYARPVITSAPSDLVTIEGDTVMLSCRADSVPPVTEMIWSYQSEQISTNLKFEVFGNGNLRINNIEKAQEGRYSCQAENDIGRSRTESAYVTVQVPPKVNIYPVDVTLDLGSDVILHCSASGDPIPSMEWKKNEEELVLSDNVVILANFSLEIRGFRKENEGSYQCIATNAAGNTHATAVVMATDIPEFTTPAVNITANQTQSTLLPCRATARESPTISWYLTDASGVRGEQIGLGGNIPGVRGFQSIVTDEGDLLFSVVTREDEGWFICQARNSIETVEMLLYLTINYPPSITSSSVQVTGEGTSLRAILKCDSDGRPFPPVSWYLPDGDLVEPVDDRYYLDVVGISSYLVIYRPEVVLHSGDFKCEAQNILGSSFNMITVSIEGIPVVVEVSADPSFSHVSLRCLSKGAPSPQIFWYLNDIIANSIPNHAVLSDGSLVVTDLEVAEKGCYKCLLQNRYGSVSAYLQVPGPPSTPEIESITSRTITLNWFPPGATSNLTVSSYQVEYFQFAGNGTILYGGNSDEPSKTIENLAPYTGYQFRVLARNGLGVGPNSDFSQVVVTAEDVPETVQNMKAEASGTNIILSWTEPRRVNGNKANIVYVIIYGPINETLDDHVTLTRGYNDETLVLLADLLPSMQYRITMRVVNIDFNLQSPDTITEVNTSFPVPVMRLQGFKIADSNSNSILVVWRAINPPAFLRYIISYHDNSRITEEEFIHVYVNNPADEYLIRRLNPATEYTVKMTYQTEGGVAPYTSVLIVSTDHVSTVEPVIEPNRRLLSVGAVIGVVFGVLLLIVLVLLLLVLYKRWRQSKNNFNNNPSPGFDPDSLWINRRFSYGETISINSTVDDSGSEKKGTYEVAIVNENYDPGDTLMSNDSAYDLAKTGLPEAMGGHLVTEGVKSEKKKKKKKKWSDDLIYKDPLNPDVVLVKKAVLGEDLAPPQPISSREMLNQEDDTPNTTLDPPDTPKDSTVEGDFPIFPSAHDEVMLADEDFVVKDNAKQEKLNKKARERKKKREREEQKERDRDFDIGYSRQKKSIADMFNVTGRFTRRRNSSLDEIPYPEEEQPGSSAAKHGDSAVLY